MDDDWSDREGNSVPNRGLADGEDAPRVITKRDLENVAVAAGRVASKETLSESFALLGINLANQEGRDAFRSDMEFVRRFRRRTELAGNRIGVAIFATIGTAIGGAMVAWFVGFLGKH